MSSLTKENALDQKKIDIIKQKYDLTKDSDILALYSALQSGQIVFSSEVGNAFDDMIYEKAKAIKEAQKTPERKNRRNIAEKNEEITSKDKKNNSDKGKKKDHSKKSKQVVVITKKELIIRKVFMGLLLFISLGCFTYFGYYYLTAYRDEKETERLNNIKENENINDMYDDEVVSVEENGETKYFKVLNQYKSLYNSNKTLIGWVKIADTVIDYPVYQTGDNEFYLTHNSELKEDKNGALFLDTQCDIKKPSTNYIIYGHNMRSGKMFGSLDKYDSVKYYEKHKIIYFDTIYEEAQYEVMYVFRSKVYNQDEITFKYYQFIDANSEEEFNSNMREMQALSFYDTGVTANYGDQLLTLSTCDYEEKDGRFVVVAKRVN